MSKKGLDDTPKTTRANRNSMRSNWSACTFLYHKKRSTSRSFLATEIIRNALLDVCNDGNAVDPKPQKDVEDFRVQFGSMQSLREGPVVRADAS